MAKKEYTIAEYAALKGIEKQHIYYLIRTNQNTFKVKKIGNTFIIVA
jgi:hypothetical protein